MRSSIVGLVLIACWASSAAADDPRPKPEPEKQGEKKPGDKKGDKKPGDKKPGDKKPGDKKKGDKKPGDKKPGDKKKVGPKGANPFPFPFPRRGGAPGAEKSEEDLLKELESKVAAVRAKAATALGSRNVTEALPKLEKLWKDPDTQVRLAAIQALAGIAKSDALLPKLVPLFGDKTEKVRFAAGFVFQQKGVKKTLPILAQALASKDRNVRYMTLQVLKRFGAEAKVAAPGVGVLLGDADAEVRVEAARTLGTMRCKEAATAMIAGLTHKTDATLRIASALELRFFKDLGAPAVPALQKLLSDKDWKPAFAAASALGGIGAKAKAAVPDLIRMLDHKIYNLRSAATGALSNIGKPAVADLAKALASERRKVKKGAAEALGRIGSDASPAVGALIVLLKNDHHQLRRVAAVALGRIGAKARAAVEALRAIEEEDDDRRVRRSARHALKRILTSR